MTDSGERWQQIRRLFDAAMKRSPGEREAFVEAECGDDAGLLQEVSALIRAGDVGNDEIEKIVRHAAVDLTQSDVTPGLDQRVGKYLLIDLLGAGGMGNVYLAKRIDQQFEHRVAIKLLHPGRRDKDIVRRFQAERQILANLEHPNIARLLDGGETDSGVPYLVMEYVDGQPIDRYCDENRLSVQDRLLLYQKICGAVDYAHRKLIVHRDIKPSNILVTGDGEPKLLDFGIAKLLDDGTAIHSVAVTREGVSIMTPEYASPEQVRAEPVSTATDIYSMGVLLYKILCGRMPYRQQAINTNLARAIQSEIPSRPSDALSSRDQLARGSESIDAISAARKTSVIRLKRRLQGDIDNVVLKALRKEPERRYPSAIALSDDIENVLTFRPVTARPASFAYRSSRFLRRYRVGVTVSVAITAILIASVIQVIQQRDRAQIAALQSEQVVTFLGELFVSASSLRVRGEEILAGDLLEAGVEDIESLDNQPQVQARLLEIMGTSYQYIGNIEKHGELMQRALDIRRNRLPHNAAAIGENLREFSESARLTGNLEEAERQLRRSVGLFIEAHGAEHGSVAYAMSRLGEVLRMSGRKIEAVDFLEQAAAMKERLGEAGDEDAIDILGNLAIALDDAGRLGEAESINRAAVAASRLSTGDLDPNTLTRIGNLGLIQLRRGNYTDAQRNIEEAYKGINKIWLTDSTNKTWVAGIKASVLLYLGQFDESLAAYEEHRRKTAIVYGRETLRYAKALQNLGQWHLTMGHHHDALEWLQQALVAATEVGEGTSNRAGSIRLRLAMVQIEAGHYAAAEKITRQTLSAADSLGRLTVTDLQRELARGLSWQGQFTEAALLFEESLSQRESFGGKTSVGLLPVLVAMSKHYRRAGEPEQALSFAKRAHEIGLTISPPGTWEPAFASAEYALALNATADSETAWRLFEKAVNDLINAFGDDDPRVTMLRREFAAATP